MRFADVDLNEDSDRDVDEGAADDAEMSGGGDQDDEEEDEEEGDPSEFIDVLDVLDGRGESDSEKGAGATQKQSAKTQLDARHAVEDGDDDDDDMGSDEGSVSDEEDEEEEGDEIVSASEDGEDGETALQDLENFVSTLDAGQKRKASDEDQHDGTDDKRPRKRRLLPEMTEAGAENEYAAAPGKFPPNLCMLTLTRAHRRGQVEPR